MGHGPPHQEAVPVFDHPHNTQRSRPPEPPAPALRHLLTLCHPHRGAQSRAPPRDSGRPPDLPTPTRGNPRRSALTARVQLRHQFRCTRFSRFYLVRHLIARTLTHSPPTLAGLTTQPPAQPGPPASATDGPPAAHTPPRQHGAGAGGRAVPALPAGAAASVSAGREGGGGGPCAGGGPEESRRCALRGRRALGRCSGRDGRHGA